MVDNQHQKISGYRDPTEDEIALMNEVKADERSIAETWRAVVDSPNVQIDTRWASIARTHFQEGFSALVRAIARPADPFAGD